MRASLRSAPPFQEKPGGTRLGWRPRYGKRCVIEKSNPEHAKIIDPRASVGRVIFHSTGGETLSVQEVVVSSSIRKNEAARHKR